MANTTPLTSFFSWYTSTLVPDTVSEYACLTPGRLMGEPPLPLLRSGKGFLDQAKS